MSSLEEPQQFEHLFRTHFGELCRIAMPLVKDEDVARDVVQEVFVELWGKRKKIQIHSTVKGYLYRAVINRSLDQVRRGARLVTIDSQVPNPVGANANVTENAVLKNELEDLVDKGMGLMPEKCRMVFHMSRFGGLKNREIATELGLSIKTIENQMGKALRILRNYLKSQLGYIPLLYLLWEMEALINWP